EKRRRAPENMLGFVLGTGPDRFGNSGRPLMSADRFRSTQPAEGRVRAEQTEPRIDRDHGKQPLASRFASSQPPYVGLGEGASAGAEPPMKDSGAAKRGWQGIAAAVVVAIPTGWLCVVGLGVYGVAVPATLFLSLWVLLAAGLGGWIGART